MAQKSLMDEIAEVRRKRQGPACTVFEILQQMDTEAERQDLRNVMDTPSVKSTHLVKVLKNRGYVISSHTMQRHRRQGCSCWAVDV